MAKWIVGIVAVLAVIGGVVFYGITRVVKSTPAYKDAARFVEGSEELRAYVGEGFRIGWLPTGTISDRGQTGEAMFRIAAKGAKAATKVTVHLVKGPSGWNVKTATYETPSDPFALLPLPKEGETSLVAEARALRAERQLEAAAAKLDEAVAAAPRDANALYLRGVVRLDLGQADRAAADFEAAALADPEMRKAFEQLALVAARESAAERVVDVWTRWLERHPSDADALHARAAAHRALGDLAAAAADEEEACRLGLESACRKATRTPAEEGGDETSEEIVEPEPEPESESEPEPE